jgi:putative hemolysin
MEDLVEELVGDIRDEHDREASSSNGGEGLLVDARTRMSALRRRVAVDGPEETPPEGDGAAVAEEGADPDESVAAHLLRRLGRVPARGERITVGDLEIEVVQATPKRILRVRVTEATNAGEGETRLRAGAVEHADGEHTGS